MTLYHWDLPQVLEDQGGWPTRDTALRFAEYASLVHEVFGDRIRFWTTLNEPFCSSMHGYADGVQAPGRTDGAAAVLAAHHLLLGHGLAIDAMRSSGRHPDHQYGITLNLAPSIPASDSTADVDAARRVDGIANRLFLDPVLRGALSSDVVEDLAPVMTFDHVQDGDLAIINQPLDFLGVNYYFRHMVAAGSRDRFRVGAAHPGAGDVDFVSRGLPELTITPSDKFQVFRPRAAGEIVFDDHHGGVDRRDPLLVHLTAVHRYPAAHKQLLCSNIIRRLGEVGVRTDDVFICIVENGFEDWHAGEPGAAARER